MKYVRGISVLDGSISPTKEVFFILLCFIGRCSKEGEEGKPISVIFINRFASSYTHSWLNSQKTKLLDVNYMSCHSTVEGRIRRPSRTNYSRLHT